MMKIFQYLIFCIFVFTNLGAFLIPLYFGYLTNYFFEVSIVSLATIFFCLAYLFGNAYLKGGLKTTSAKNLFWIALGFLIFMLWRK